MLGIYLTFPVSKSSLTAYLFHYDSLVLDVI